MTKLYDDTTSVATGSYSVFNLLGFGPGPDYQSFTTNSTTNTLTSLVFELSDAAGAFDLNNSTITLFSNTGGGSTPVSAGASLSTLGTIADSSTGTAASLVTLTLSSTYTLATNTTYWIGLSNLMTGGGIVWYETNAPTGSGTSGQASQHGTTVDTANQFIMAVNGMCFAAGALVLTAEGEVPVEKLQEGDLVLGIHSGQFQRVRWLGYREVDLLAHPDPDSINPVRVCANAFGPGQPYRDLILSPNHALYVDGELIAVRYLLNGATIRQEHWDRITYYHVELESHDVMMVDGMTAESFLDIGNRSAFSNGGEPVMLHPDFARQTWDAQSCAPDMPKGEELTQLRQMLLDRAAPLGHATTDDPDLCVVAGQRRIRPTEVTDGFSFNLPEGTETVRIESRRFKPSEMRADGNDTRQLGVGVLSLMLDDAQVALDCDCMTSGWHEPEPGLRWTDGSATLRVDGARSMTLQLLDGAYYWLTVNAAKDVQKAA
jgi:hypothetical protein